jgi:hypothetical protein
MVLKPFKSGSDQAIKADPQKQQRMQQRRTKHQGKDEQAKKVQIWDEDDERIID